ncbi:TPA: hypothetical protein ACH3X1_010863 [Trebouxia sp. C0004]
MMLCGIKALPSLADLKVGQASPQTDGAVEHSPGAPAATCCCHGRLLIGAYLAVKGVEA